MTDGNNFDKFVFEAIDNPVVSVNLFSYVLISIFRNYPARFGKLRDSFNYFDYFFGKKDGVVFRIFSDITTDFF